MCWEQGVFAACMLKFRGIIMQQSLSLLHYICSCLLGADTMLAAVFALAFWLHPQRCLLHHCAAKLALITASLGAHVGQHDTALDWDYHYAVHLWAWSGIILVLLCTDSTNLPIGFGLVPLWLYSFILLLIKYFMVRCKWRVGSRVPA